MKKLFYLGRFPGPIGGVTIKNCAVYNLLKENLAIKKLDLSKIKNGDFFVAFDLLRALFSRKSQLVIGTSDSARRAVTKLLYAVNRKTLRSSCLMVMGGRFANLVADDSQYQRWVKEYRRVFVETELMRKRLNDVGVVNVDVFPNCRNRPGFEIQPKPRGSRLKCVFFSMIYPEKGVDLILEAAKLLPEVDFDFWGEVDREYENEFVKNVNSMENCRYLGALRAKNQDESYAKLCEYDLILLPTRCFGEGVPGALVEAKIAALPAIVSNYPGVESVVKNDGLILDDYSVEALVKSIRELNANDAKLAALKEETVRTREQYYFDNYRDLLLRYLQ